MRKKTCQWWRLFHCIFSMTKARLQLTKWWLCNQHLLAGAAFNQVFFLIKEEYLISFKIQPTIFFRHLSTALTGALTRRVWKVNGDEQHKTLRFSASCYFSLLPNKRNTLHWRLVRSRHKPRWLEFSRNHSRCSNGHWWNKQQLWYPEGLPFGTFDKGFSGW